MFKFYIYKFGQFCVTHLPLRVAYRVSMWLSDLHYFMSFRDRRAVRNNLKIICPHTENLSGMTREVFRNFGLYLVDFFRMAKKIDRDFIKTNVTSKNFHYIEDELKKGKGAIFLTAHLGNWELGGVLLGMMGYKMVAIALPHKERPVNDLFNKQRQSQGVTVVPIHQAVRRCLQTLKDNGLVAVVADRDFTENGILMDFLGRPTMIPKGAAIFAAKTGAPIIPSFLMRDEQDRFTFHIERPIYSPQVVDGVVEDEVLKEIMAQYKVVIEDKVRQFPTQWLMFRQFWTDVK